MSGVTPGKREGKRLQPVDVVDVYSLEWADYLNIDLKMRPSRLLTDDEDVAREGGFLGRIQRVWQEFAWYRGLQPIRVSVIGAPMAGKSEVARHLKTMLRVKTMTVRDMITYIK